MIGVAVLVALGMACGRSSPSPTQPTPRPLPGAPPVPTPGDPLLTVTDVSPDSGSIEGTYFKITGTGFRAPLVKLDGVLIPRTSSPDSTTIHVTAPAHAAGPVDIVVTNHDGQTVRLSGGFTYAAPESFDVNGNWEGGADSNYETLLRFTIADNAVTRVSCGPSAVTFSPPLRITHGAFTLAGDHDDMSGRILSPSHAQGTISIPSCISYPWFAAKQQ
jgi:IPT/TIG domain-containing protein